MNPRTIPFAFVIGTLLTLAPLSAQTSWGWEHEASASTISGNSTYLEVDRFGRDPASLLLVSSRWVSRDGKAAGAYHDHPIGVWFDTNLLQWAIFNQDGAPMVEGARFSVSTETTRSQFPRFVWDSASALDGPRTWIDSIFTNHRPYAVLAVTANWNPGTESGVYDAHPVGVLYDLDRARWAIVNLDGAAMPSGAKFNVTIGGVFHLTSSSNIAGNYTDLELAGRPDASSLYIVTPNLTPPGGSAGDFPHNVGAFFDAALGRPAVFNQDRAPMPEGMGFNILSVSRIPE